MSGSKVFGSSYDFPPLSYPSGKPMLPKSAETPVAFTDLSDVFASYVGHSGKYVIVNATEDGLTITAVGGGDLYYLKTVSVAASPWNIAHLLGKYPSIVLMDTSFQIMEAEIVHTDINNAVVTFATNQDGYAICN